MLAQDLSWFKQLKAEYVWAIEAAVLAGFTVILVYLETLFYKKVKPKFMKIDHRWEVAVMTALHKPLRLFICVLGLSFFLDIVGSYSDEKRMVFEIVPTVRTVFAIFCLLWFCLSFIKEIEKILMTTKSGGDHLDKTSVRAIGQVLRVTVIVTAVFVILQNTLGVSIGAILAFAGGGGITIGWAAKDMIANFFGGLMIFLDRPFVIGDRIRYVSKSLEGTVEYIGWRLTSITTPDKTPLYIPNSLFLTDTIENLSRMSHRKINTKLGVRYQDLSKISAIAQDIRVMLKDHHAIDHEENIIVNLVQCGPSSLDYLISAYTKTIDYEEFHKVQQDVLIKILQIIQQKGAECAYPTTVIQLPQEIKLPGQNT